jgi:hypothetical protein
MDFYHTFSILVFTTGGISTIVLVLAFDFSFDVFELMLCLSSAQIIAVKIFIYLI